MDYKERLSWILDKPGHIFDEEKYRENIEFVHSIGKKCDCVGWSELDLSEPDANEILDKIQAFCVSHGWRARGVYERVYTGNDSEWFEIKFEQFKDNTLLDIDGVYYNISNKMYFDVISAYREMNIAPKTNHHICVPDRFRKSCIKNGIADIDFLWVQDKGRYRAEQYFNIFPRKSIPRVICGAGIDKNNRGLLEYLGGYLPKISSMFYDLRIDIQDCFIKEDMPKDGGIALAYYNPKDYIGQYRVLIHKTTAQKLIEDKAISYNSLKPACVIGECPKDYVPHQTDIAPKPSERHFEEKYNSYIKLMSKERPEYTVKQDDALKLLRKNKRDRKSDFNKALSKKSVDSIGETLHSKIISYYQVTDGCLLSDEYTFLSYADSVKETEAFVGSVFKEELLDKMPNGIVIATCADGDQIIFDENERVVRFSHEDLNVVSEWDNMAAFIVDALNDLE